MGKNCSGCAPCLSGLPCGGHKAPQGMVGYHGYGGIRRITNWGAANNTPNATLHPVQAWLVAGGEDLPQLVQLIDDEALQNSQASSVLTQIEDLGQQLVDGTLSKISYLNQVHALYKSVGIDPYVVTTVLTSCRKKALMYGGGAMIGGLVLSGGVSMTANKMDDYAHVFSLVAVGWGGWTLAKAYGLV